MGCQPTEKLDEDEAREAGDQINKLLPAMYAAKVRQVHPYGLNWQLSFWCDGGPRELNRVCWLLRDQMAAKSYRIKGKELRAVVEISPERRRQYKDFKESTEWLAAKGVASNKFLTCPKSFAIWTTPGRLPVGGFVDGKWEWNNVGLNSLGIEESWS